MYGNLDNRSVWVERPSRPKVILKWHDIHHKHHWINYNCQLENMLLNVKNASKRLVTYVDTHMCRHVIQLNTL